MCWQNILYFRGVREEVNTLQIHFVSLRKCSGLNSNVCDVFYVVFIFLPCFCSSVILVS